MACTHLALQLRPDLPVLLISPVVTVFGRPHRFLHLLLRGLLVHGRSYPDGEFNYEDDQQQERKLKEKANHVTDSRDLPPPREGGGREREINHRPRPRPTPQECEGVHEPAGRITKRFIDSTAMSML